MWTIKEYYLGVPIYQNERGAQAIRMPPGFGYRASPSDSDFIPLLRSQMEKEIDEHRAALAAYHETVTKAERAEADRQRAEADALPGIYADLQERLA